MKEPEFEEFELFLGQLIEIVGQMQNYYTLDYLVYMQSSMIKSEPLRVPPHPLNLMNNQNF